MIRRFAGLKWDAIFEQFTEYDFPVNDDRGILDSTRLATSPTFYSSLGSCISPVIFSLDTIWRWELSDPTSVSIEGCMAKVQRDSDDDNTRSDHFDLNGSRGIVFLVYGRPSNPRFDAFGIRLLVLTL